MQAIKDRLLGKKGRRLSDDDLVAMHHHLMVVYGWIPFEEFKHLPLPALWGLYYEVQQEIAKRENLRLCWLKFMGVKHPK